MYQALGLHYPILVFFRLVYFCSVRHTPSLTDVFDLAHVVNVRALALVRIRAAKHVCLYEPARSQPSRPPCDFDYIQFILTRASEAF